MSDPKAHPDLVRFEENLNPASSQTDLSFCVLGYGEISTVFQIGTDRYRAYKRMPLFETRKAAEDYVETYQLYCRHLKEAGIRLPPDELKIVSVPGRPVTLYIIQRQYPEKWFAHHLIHSRAGPSSRMIFQKVCEQIDAVWKFNQNRMPGLELALDGQLSNWLFENKDPDASGPLFVDTSTPLFRVNGVEQLDPELFLKSAPGFLRWVIRLLFLKDVMNRYYDRRQVLIDLAANLFKEQRPDLIPLALSVINNFMKPSEHIIEDDEIRRYYTKDKLIWTLFLMFRRMDRWLKTRLLRQHYDFLLPGKISR